MRTPIASIAALVLASLQPALAQTYPSRNVRLIVPFAAGGSADGVGRAVAERLGAGLGQTVLVENRPGASASIGAALVAKADPDGHTLFLMPGTHVLARRLLKSVPFDPINDFTPIATVVFVPTVLIAGKDQPFATMREMLQHARTSGGKVAVGVLRARRTQGSADGDRRPDPVDGAEVPSRARDPGQVLRARRGRRGGHDPGGTRNADASLRRQEREAARFGRDPTRVAAPTRARSNEYAEGRV